MFLSYDKRSEQGFWLVSAEKLDIYVPKASGMLIAWVA
jgi:hypothetical protein